jgi:leucyl aminopeptidase (aminopeptidase T)
MPKVQEPISVDQILPALRTVVKRTPQRGFNEGLSLKPEERVLIITDSTISPILPQGFEEAIREFGGHADTVNLEGYPYMEDPVALVDEQNTQNWYPDWVWEAAKQADVVLCLAFLKFPHTPKLPWGREAKKKGEAIKGRAVQWELPPDMLLNSSLTYPLDVWDAIDDKTWELLGGARRIEIVEEGGTNLTFDLTAEDWATQRAEDGEGPRGGARPYTPGHIFVPFPKAKRLEGQVAIRSLTFGGPIPLTRLTVEERRVTKVEGGGAFGDTLRQSFEELKEETYPGLPGPGTNWISTFAMCTNPKFRRSPSYESARGSARVHSWCLGHRRSGFLHASVGSALINPKHKIIRHFDMMFPTVIADGRPVIEEGHLVALDAPEVKRVAERYGDPDNLLREDWIPDRNAAI